MGGNVSYRTSHCRSRQHLANSTEPLPADSSLYIIADSRPVDCTSFFLLLCVVDQSIDVNQFWVPLAVVIQKNLSCRHACITSHMRYMGCEKRERRMHHITYEVHGMWEEREARAYDGGMTEEAVTMQKVRVKELERTAWAIFAVRDIWRRCLSSAAWLGTIIEGPCQTAAGPPLALFWGTWSGSHSMFVVTLRCT